MFMNEAPHRDFFVQNAANNRRNGLLPESQIDHSFMTKWSHISGTYEISG